MNRAPKRALITFWLELTSEYDVVLFCVVVLLADGGFVLQLNDAAAGLAVTHREGAHGDLCLVQTLLSAVLKKQRRVV